MPDKNKKTDDDLEIIQSASPTKITPADDDLEIIQSTVTAAPQEGLKKNTPDVAPAPKVKSIASQFSPVDNSPFTFDADPYKTDWSINVLSQDATTNAGQYHPDLQQNINKIPFTDPTSYLHQLTNPAGDPQVTSQNLKTRIANIEQQRKDEAQNTWQNTANAVPGTPTINEKYDQQISALKDASAHMLSLQLFNRDYSQKKYTPAETSTALDALQKQRDEEVANAKEQLQEKVKGEDKYDVDKATGEFQEQVRSINDKFHQQAQQLANNTKYNPILLGAEQASMLGDQKAQADLQRLNAGQPIDGESQFKYNVAGNKIIQTGVANSVNEQAIKEGTAHADQDESQLYANNKQYVLGKAQQAVGNAKYKDESAVLHAIVPSFFLPGASKGDIKKYGEQLGYNPQIVEDLQKSPDEIPKSASLAEQFAKGFISPGVGVAGSLYEQGIRGLGAATGGDMDAINERFAPGWQEHSGLDAIVAGNTPSDQNRFSNVRGFLGQIAQTAGFISGLGGAVKELAPLAGEKGANFAVMSALGYNDAYNTAKEIIGDKPDEEGKRQLYSIISGLTQGAIFSIHPPSQLVRNALGETSKSGEQFLNELKGADPNDIINPELKDKIKNYVSGTAKELGYQVGQVDLNRITQNIYNKVADKKNDHDITEGLGDETITSAITMLLPSIASTIGHERMQTPLNKAVAFEIGADPARYSQYVIDQRNKGALSDADANKMYSLIGSMNKAVQNTPIQNKDGGRLSPDQIKDYAYNLFQSNQLQKKSDRITKQAELDETEPDKAQIDPINKSIAALQTERQQILTNPELKKKTIEEGDSAPKETPKDVLNDWVQHQTERYKDTYEKAGSELPAHIQDRIEKIKEDPEASLEKRLQFLKIELSDAETQDDKDYYKGQLNEVMSFINRLKQAKKIEAKNAKRSVATNSNSETEAGQQKKSPEEGEISENKVSLNPQNTATNEKDNGQQNDQQRQTPIERQGQEARVQGNVNREVRDETGQDRQLNEQSTDNEADGQEPPAFVLPEKLRKAYEEAGMLEEPAQEKPTQPEQPKEKTYSPFEAIDLGDLEGRKKSNQLDRAIKATPVDEPFGVKEKGESFTNAVDRTKQDWENLKATAEPNSVLVAHSGLLKLINAVEKDGTKWDDYEALKKAYNTKDEAPEGKLIEFKNDKGEPFYVVRHGESEDNANNRIRKKTSPLTEKGQEQARGIAQQLKEKGIENPNIISSDLTRGKQTKAIIETELSKRNIPPQPEKPLHLMTGKELRAYHDELKKFNEELDKRILGIQYEEYKKNERTLHRGSSIEKEREAQKKIAEIESQLTKKQLDELDGIGLPEGIIADEDDVKDYINKVEYVESADDERELAHHMSQALINLNDAPDDIKDMKYDQKLALSQFLAAQRIIGERGYDGKKISEAALKEAANKFGDKDDAEFMLSRYINYFKNLKEVHSNRLQDATTQSAEPQQEGGTEGNKLQHARTDAQREQAPQPETKGGDSNTRGQGQQEKAVVQRKLDLKSDYDQLKTSKGKKSRRETLMRQADRLEAQNTTEQPSGKQYKSNATEIQAIREFVREVTPQRKVVNTFNPAEHQANLSYLKENLTGDPQTFEEAVLRHISGGGTFKETPGFIKHLPTRNTNRESRRKRSQENEAARKFISKEGTPADTFASENVPVESEQQYGEADVAQIISDYPTKVAATQRLVDIVRERNIAEGKEKEPDIHSIVITDREGNVEHIDIDLNSPTAEQEIAAIMGADQLDMPQGFDEEGHPYFNEIAKSAEEIASHKLTDSDYDKLKSILDQHTGEDGKVDIDKLLVSLSSIEDGLSDKAKELINKFVPFPSPGENEEALEALRQEVQKYETANPRRETTDSGPINQEPAQGDGGRSDVSDVGTPPTGAEGEGNQQAIATGAKTIEAATDERSVATNSNSDAKPIPNKIPAQRIAEIELQLQKEHASQKLEAQKRDAAEKKGDVSEANKHNENWYKKQDKIDHLEEERTKLQHETEKEEITTEKDDHQYLSDLHKNQMDDARKELADLDKQFNKAETRKNQDAIQKQIDASRERFNTAQKLKQKADQKVKELDNKDRKISVADHIRGFKIQEEEQVPEAGARTYKNAILDDETLKRIGIRTWNRAIEQAARLVEAGYRVRFAIEQLLHKINEDAIHEGKELTPDEEDKLLAAFYYHHPDVELMQPEDFRKEKQQREELPDAVKEALDAHIKEVKNNQKTLKEVLAEVSKHPVSDIVRQKAREYLTSKVQEEVFRADGENIAKDALRAVGNDFEETRKQLKKDFDNQILDADSETKRQNLNNKQAAAEAYLDIEETKQKVANGEIKPDYTHKPTKTPEEEGKFVPQKDKRSSSTYINTADVLGAGEAAIQTPGAKVREGEGQNFVTQRRLAKSRAKYAIEKVRKFLGIGEERKGSFFDRLRDEAGPEGLNQLGLYMYAQHAPERNEQNRMDREAKFSAKVNELQQRIANAKGDDTKLKYQSELNDILAQKNKDYQLMPDGGSGMTNQQAEEVMQEAEADGKKEMFDRYAQEFRDNVTIPHLEMMHESQLISDEEFDKLKDHYKYYIPLRVKDEVYNGKDELRDDNEQKSIQDIWANLKEWTTGRASKASEKDADKIFAEVGRSGRGLYRSKGAAQYTFLDRNNPILQAEHAFEQIARKAQQNKADIAFANFWRDNPNPDLVEIKSPEYNIFRDKEGNLISADEDLSKRPKNSFDFYENGKKQYMVVKDPGLRKMFTKAGRYILVDAMNKVSAWTRTVNTMKAPYFIVRNIFRDVQDANLNIAMTKDEQNPYIGKQYRKNLFNAVKGIGTAIKDVAAGRESQWVNEWKAWEDDWKKNGGQISFYSPETLLKRVTETNKQFEHYGQLTGKKAATYVFRQLGHLSTWVENSTRIQVYRASVEGMARKIAEDQGIPMEEALQQVDREKAALISRNATVDFERKGFYGTYINAFKPFVNAGIQGDLNVAYGLYKNPKRAAKVLGALVGLGVLQTEMNELMSNCDDVTNPDCYGQIDENMKEKNFVIPNRLFGGHGFTYVPGPFNFGWFNYFGVKADEFVHNKIGAGDFAAKSVGSLMDYFDPTGGADESIGQKVAGNFAPVVGLSTNTSPFGTPIHPEDAPGQYPSDAYFPSTPNAFVQGAELLHKISGGTTEDRGIIEIHPNTLQYLYSQATGGIGKFTQDVASTTSKTIHGEPVKTNEKPFINIFEHTSNLRPLKEEYFGLLDKFNKGTMKQEDAPNVIGRMEEINNTLLQNGDISPTQAAFRMQRVQKFMQADIKQEIQREQKENEE